MNRYEKAAKRWFGRIFIRNDRDGKGFQMLVYGCFWMSVREHDPKTGHYAPSRDGFQCFSDCSILWSDVMTVGMPRAM